MNRLLVAGALFLFASACTDAAPPTPEVTVTNSTCRPTPNGVDVTGCYATFVSTVDDRLVTVASPVASEGLIHKVTMDDGVMRMRELPNGVPLPAGKPVRLAPGDDHMMLLGLANGLNEGETVSIAMTFAKAPAVGLRGTVAQPAL